MKQSDIDLVLETFPKLLSANVKLKLLDDDEPTEWSRWLISPTQGYVELEQYGPVSIKDIDWLEIRVS